MQDRIDPLEFRRALGKFATGVTIITTCGEDGTPCGVTASSFNSVSLDPPLVLWSLSNSSRSMAAFQNAAHFAVHVLGADQEELSNRFAARGADKFAGLACESATGGVPLLPGCAARFLCRTSYRYEGGDHTIFVGEVVEFTGAEKSPLIFHGGKYAEAKERWKEAHTTAAIDLVSGSIGNDLFLYLVPAMYFQATYPVRAAVKEIGLAETEYLTLALLANNGALSEPEQTRRLDYTGIGPTLAQIQAMEAKGWLIREGELLDLTDAGRTRYLQVLARIKAHEEWVLSHFATHEIVEMKRLMKKVLAVTASDIPPSLGTI